MGQGWTLLLLGAPGQRPRRVALTKRTVVALLAVCLLGTAAGVWAGWLWGEHQSAPKMAPGSAVGVPAKTSRTLERSSQQKPNEMQANA